MKKILLKTGLTLVLILLSSTTYSQELYMGSEAEVTITPGNFVFVGNNLTVDSGANLYMSTSETPATQQGLSASLLVSGTFSGSLQYLKYKPLRSTTVMTPPVIVSNPDIDAGFLAANPLISKLNDWDHDSNPATDPIDFYGLAYYNGDVPFSASSAVGKWVYYDNTPDNNTETENFDFQVGRGYIFNTTTPVSIQFNGRIPNSDLESTINLTTVSPVANHRWKSVGNPYPSYLSVADFIVDNGDFLDDGVFGILVGTRTSDASPFRFRLINDESGYFIAPGETFMILPRDGDEDIVFSKNSQVHRSSDSPQPSSKNAIYPQIQILLTSGGVSRETLVKYQPGATVGLDKGYDALAFQMESPVFSINSRLTNGDRFDEDFMVQVLPESDYESSIVPLSINAPASQKIKISANINGFTEGIEFYLEDRKENIFIPIGGDNSYTLKTNSSEGGVGRFYLHTRRESINNIGDVALTSSLSLYKLNRNTIRVVGFEGVSRAQIKVYDVTGKQVLNESFSGSNFNDFSIFSNVKTGIYIVNVTGEDKSITKKMIIE